MHSCGHLGVIKDTAWFPGQKPEIFVYLLQDMHITESTSKGLALSLLPEVQIASPAVAPLIGHNCPKTLWMCGIRRYLPQTFELSNEIVSSYVLRTASF